MEFTLEIVTPDCVVYKGKVKSVVLTTTEGEIGVLDEHIPLLTVIEPGEIRVYKEDGQPEYLAVDKGFARVYGERGDGAGMTVSVLTEAAIDVAEIDMSKIDEAVQRARHVLDEAKERGDYDHIEQLEAVIRFSIAQKLVKKKHL